MPFLLRVVLPDRPGSLGAVATALGAAGADITAVAVVEQRPDGVAVDDFVVEPAPGRYPDGLVSACTRVPGVSVEFVGHYGAGAQLYRDLEAVEEMTQAPEQAAETLVDLVPCVFPTCWGLLLEACPTSGGVRLLRASGGAPEVDRFSVPWLPLLHAQRVVAEPAWAPPSWTDVVAAVAPLYGERVVVAGRVGGPEVLDSEVARLAHLAALAGTVARSAG